MKDTPQMCFRPNPRVEALARDAATDPRLTDEQREQAAARLRDLAKIQAANKAQQMRD